MYIELLKQYAANIDSLKIQPAVTGDAIHEAEVGLDILFPNELKELLCETNGDNYFLLPLEFIIKDNLDFRSMNPEIIEPELFDFSEFLFFATNGCGDYYGYKIEYGIIGSTSIFVFDHEEYTARVVAADIAELIKLYYQDQI